MPISSSVAQVLQDKVVLVTGACGGIGRVSCTQFLAAGAKLFVTDLDPVALQELQQELGENVSGLAANLCEPDEVSALFAALRTHYGRLDGAFNNAGRGSGEIALVDMPLQEWRNVIDINLTGTFLCLQAEIKLMLESGAGSIVNNSSILGLNGGFNPAYTSAKHGLCGLTKSAAMVYAPKNIRVNAVCPGLIEAGMGLKVLSRDSQKVDDYVARHPLGRPGSAQEVADAVQWLLSDQSSYVTGHMLPVDGGYSSI